MIARSARFSWSTCVWSLLLRNSRRQRSVKWSECVRNEPVTSQHRHWPACQPLNRRPVTDKSLNTSLICGDVARGVSCAATEPIAAASVKRGYARWICRNGNEGRRRDTCLNVPTLIKVPKNWPPRLMLHPPSPSRSMRCRPASTLHRLALNLRSFLDHKRIIKVNYP